MSAGTLLRPIRRRYLDDGSRNARAQQIPAACPPKDGRYLPAQALLVLVRELLSDRATTQAM